jgi:microcystin-dependent protein
MKNDPVNPRRSFLARLLAAFSAGAILAKPEDAQAATGEGSPYVGEIRMFAASWAPVGWAICDGQLLSIGQYETLFNLIGTTYGGDGQLTFALPDLRGRAPVHAGTTIQLGEFGGNEAWTLGPFEAPLHNHSLQSSSSPGLSDDPNGRVPARSAVGDPRYSAGGDTGLASTTLVFAGQSQEHNNMMPSLCVNFIMCLDGIWPSQI